MEWVCPKGQRFETDVQNVSPLKPENYCPICNRMHVQIGFKDLVTKDREIAKEVEDWDPKLVTQGSNKERAFRCPQGHLYSIPVATRTTACN